MDRKTWANQRNKVNLQKLTLKKRRLISYLTEFKISIVKILNELKENTATKCNQENCMNKMRLSTR